jgi:hypothetical protein
LGRTTSAAGAAAARRDSCITPLIRTARPVAAGRARNSKTRHLFHEAGQETSLPLLDFLSGNEMADTNAPTLLKFLHTRIAIRPRSRRHGIEKRYSSKDDLSIRKLTGGKFQFRIEGAKANSTY